MAIYVRKQVQNPTTTLLVTFLLGAAIGFSLGYALFGMQKDEGAVTPVAETVAEMGEPAEAATPAAEPSAESAVDAPEEPAVEPGAEPADGAMSSAVDAAEPVDVAVAAETGEPAVAPEEAAASVPMLTPTATPWPGAFMFVGVSGPVLTAEAAAMLGEVRPAGVVLQGESLGDAEQTQRLVAEIRKAVGMGESSHDFPLIAVAQEGGAMNPLGVPDAPKAVDLGADRDIDGARTAGRAYGAAAASRGIGLILGPVIDVLVPGASVQRMADRVFSGDQEVVTLLGLAMADGIMDSGALSLVKYYPGIGTPRKVDGKDLYFLEPANDVARTAELMWPFSEAAAQGIPGIIVGQVAVPVLDGEHPQRPAALSPILVQRVLRDTWSYPGLVIADDLSICAGMGIAPDKAIIDAVMAGCDGALYLEPSLDRIREMAQALRGAMDGGLITAARAAESVKRLDAARVRLASMASGSVLPAPPEGPSVEGAAPAVAPSGADPVPEAVESPAEQAELPSPEGAEPAPEAAAQEPAAVPEAAAEVDDSEGSTVESAPAAEPTAETEPAAETAPAPETPAAQPSNTTKVTHEVQTGDTLSRIASKYGVKQSDIMAWNKMKDQTVKLGTNLVIHPPAAVDDTAQASDEPVPASGAPEPPAPSAPAVEYGTHVVIPGDTALRIAGQYGITVKELMELNKLDDPNNVQLGKTLRVPKRP